MPVMLQLRRWMRTAPPSRLTATALALGLVGLLLVTSLMPAGTGSTTVGAGRPNSAAGSVPTPVAGATDGAPGSGAPAGGTGGAAPAGGAGPAPSAAVASAGAPSNTQAGATSSGAGATTAGAGGGAARVASDRGVTPAEVKIGFLNLNFSSVPGAKEAIGLRDDIDRVNQAYVAYINGRGGVAGRKVVAVQRSTDILDESDQNAACTAMVADNKVFAISSTAISAPTAAKCITVDGKTPMVDVLAPSEAVQRAAGGYDITLIRTIDRIYAEWAAALREIGFLNPGDKIGIVADNCEPNLTVVNQVLVPAVRAAGAGTVDVRVHDCAIANSQQQMPGIVSYFAANGFQKILPADCPYAIVPFLAQAKAINYRPKFSISDYCNSSADALAQTFDPDEFGGTVGITSTYSGGNGSKSPLTPEMQACSKILTDAGLPGIDYTPRNAEALAHCDYLFLLVKLIQKLGPNPTRQALAYSVGSFGDYRAGSTPLSTYRPGKFSGGELIHTIRFEGSCRCYSSISGLRPGRF
jgi:ABC-type branched-subunit amino acid transport system substrate-binding protein